MIICSNNATNRSSPLVESHCTLCSSAFAWKPEQFRDSAIQIAERIRIEQLLFKSQAIRARVPSCAATHIPCPIQREDDCLIEARWIPGGRRVSCVVLHQNEPRIRELLRAIASAATCPSSTERPDQSDAIHAIRRDHSAIFRQAAIAVCGSSPAVCRLAIFFSSIGSDQLAIAQQRARRITEDSPKPENDHLLFSALFDLGPRVAQAHSAIADDLVRRRILIHTEISQSFELIPAARSRVAQARLHLAARQALRAIRDSDWP